jgi:Domain of unknown function (DUF397)
MIDRQAVPQHPHTAAALQGAIWRTSSYSGTQGNCVEIALNLNSVVAVRDSKDRGGSVLTFTPHAWQAFIRRI